MNKELSQEQVLNLSVEELKLQIQQMQEMLHDFIMPLSYDGSESIFNQLNSFLKQVVHDLAISNTQTALKQQQYQILEQLYFYYKCPLQYMTEHL